MVVVASAVRRLRKKFFYSKIIFLFFIFTLFYIFGSGGQVLLRVFTWREFEFCNCE